MRTAAAGMRHFNAPKSQWFNAVRLAARQLSLTAFQLPDGSVTTGYQLLTQQPASWTGMEPFYAPVRFSIDAKVRADKFEDVAAPGWFLAPNAPHNADVPYVWNGHRHVDAPGGMQVFLDRAYATRTRQADTTTLPWMARRHCRLLRLYHRRRRPLA